MKHKFKRINRPTKQWMIHCVCCCFETQTRSSMAAMNQIKAPASQLPLFAESTKEEERGKAWDN